MFGTVLVTLTRGGIPECEHHGAYCVWQRGKVVRSRGEIDVPTFFRSAAKPLQALTVVASGAADRFRFTPEELAITVGSHDGSPDHVRVASSILAKAGEKAELLRCAGHPPLAREVMEEYVRRGHRPGRIEDNCSGKHAGMIAAAKALGADPASYADPSHPVQRSNLAFVARFTGVPEGKVILGTDGCAAPNFAVPVRAMAEAAGRFASPDDMPPATAAACRRIQQAVFAHPEMVAGPRRFDTRIIRAGGGRLLSKMGAEGVQIIAGIGEGLGIAIKIADGAERAVQAVASALLIDLGLLRADQLSEYHARPVVTREGKPVGETLVVL